MNKKITTKDEKKKSILSRRGYTIRKEKYSPIIHKIRKDLMVKLAKHQLNLTYTYPRPYSWKVFTSFIYRKYYGLKELGEPQEINIDAGDDISLEFKGLRAEQVPTAEKFIEAAIDDTGGGLISLRCEEGKLK